MNNRTLSRILMETQRENGSSLKLDDGSHVAVIGGGPAGSFFSYFLLDMAGRAGLNIHVDIYEPRDFNAPGPLGCNMCGGVLYESLVQSLAVEGINLPTTVVQQGIGHNMLHFDIGNVLIQTPRHEKRIATTFRGIGPRGLVEIKGGSLDGYLMQSAVAKGARYIQRRVDEVRLLPGSDPSHPENRLVQVKPPGGDFRTYELLAVTSGVNTALLKRFQDLDFGYQPPRTSKLLVREYYLGQDVISKYIGPVFHAFLLDIPGLDYGAIIPKGEYVTVCLLSSHGNLEAGVLETFLSDSTVKRVLPPNFSVEKFSCYCGPRINVMGSAQPYGDRIVFIGDSGVSRLYKDGIGASYRAAKVAASTAIFQGISKADFKRYYLPFCRKMDFDNQIGKLLFKMVGHLQKMQFARRAVLRMVSREQQGKANAERGMSMLMWNMLTGGASYSDVLRRTLRPAFWTRFLGNLAISLRSAMESEPNMEKPLLSLSDNTLVEVDRMKLGVGALGKMYQDGETIVREGEAGDCMYVVQDGYVEVLANTGSREVQLDILGKNEFFGEMAIFEHEIRSATVRTLGPARILTVDHKNFLRRIHEDPSLAYRLMEVMSRRVRRLSGEVTRLRHTQPPSRKEYFKAPSKPDAKKSVFRNEETK